MQKGHLKLFQFQSIVVNETEALIEKMKMKMKMKRDSSTVFIKENERRINQITKEIVVANREITRSQYETDPCDN
jgi:hypothetical protein